MENKKHPCAECHNYLYNGIIRIKLKEPEYDWIECEAFGEEEPRLIKRKTYFPERHQWHCSKCGKILRLKVYDETVEEVKG